MLRNNADVRQCSYFELGLPLAAHTINKAQDGSTFLPGGGGWGTFTLLSWQKTFLMLTY